MPEGTCDPATRGALYNEGELAIEQSEEYPRGAVTLSYRYGWDGVSAKPDCVGPLLRIRVVNNTSDTWYAHFQGRRGTWRRVTLDPNETRNVGQQALTNAGFIDNTDLEGLYITRSTTPPTITRPPRP